MNVLDENVIESQRQRLRGWRIRTRQIGVEIASKGIEDTDIIPLLQQLRRPTFFTRDRRFYQRTLCHARYCLAVLDVRATDVAAFARRVLRHPDFNTDTKRLGAVIRASHTGLTVWRLHAQNEERHNWPRA